MEAVEELLFGESDEEDVARNEAVLQPLALTLAFPSSKKSACSPSPKKKRRETLDVAQSLVGNDSCY